MYLKKAVLFDFFGYSRGVLAQIFGNLTKRHVLAQRSLDEDSVLSG